MTRMHVLLACIGLLAAATPWIVVKIVAVRAAGFGHALATPPVRAARQRLNVATVLLGAIVVGTVPFVTPPSLAFGVVALGAFAIVASFGFTALHAIDLATHPARVIEAKERVASLQPRALGAHLPFAVRLLPYAIGTAGVITFVDALAQPAPGTRALIAVGFAAGALVFLLLYDAWMREEVSGGQAAGGRAGVDTERRVRQIFAMQTALVASLLVVANLLVRLNWRGQTDFAVAVSLAGGLIGVIGCAKAIASGLSGQRYALTSGNQRNTRE